MSERRRSFSHDDDDHGLTSGDLVFFACTTAAAPNSCGWQPGEMGPAPDDAAAGGARMVVQR